MFHAMGCLCEKCGYFLDEEVRMLCVSNNDFEFQMTSFYLHGEKYFSGNALMTIILLQVILVECFWLGKSFGYYSSSTLVCIMVGFRRTKVLLQ